MKNAHKSKLIPNRATRNPADRRICAAIAGMLAVGLALIASVGRSNAATENVIYSFTGGTDGAYPGASLIADNNGVLYGTTAGGGTGCFGNGCGTVFALTPPATAGGPWTESVLYSFGSSATHGGSPTGLIERGGTLYGTTILGGASYGGTVFSLTPPVTSGGLWTESVLYAFAGGSDGSGPMAGFIANLNGTLFGTTYTGGAGGPGETGCLGYFGCGTVFALAPPATPGGA